MVKQKQLELWNASLMLQVGIGETQLANLVCHS